MKKPIKHRYILEVDIVGAERIRTAISKSEYDRMMQSLSSQAVPYEEHTYDDIYRATGQIGETDKVRITRDRFTQGTTDIYLIHHEAKDGYTLVK